MMVRKLTEEDYLFMMQWLDETEPKDPMEAFYTVGMTVDESDYFLKILPDRYNRIAVLQAVRILPEQMQLITDNLVLNSLLELWLFQYIKEKEPRN